MNAASPVAERGAMRWPEWRLVLLLMAVCGLAHFNRVSMPVAADLQIGAQYQLSTTELGWIYSAFLAAYTLMMIPGGWFIDRFGPRLALALVCCGSAGFILLTAGAGLLSSSWAALVWLAVVRALMGAVSTPLHPAAAKAVAVSIPVAHRSLANGLATGAALVGIASTYVVFGALVDWLDWQGAFVVTAGTTLLLGFVWLAGTRGLSEQNRSVARRPSARVAERPSAAHSMPWFARHQNLILLTFSYGAVGYFQYLIFYWVHHYFDVVLQLGEQQSRWYATIPNLAMAVGMPLGGWISDRVQAWGGWRAGRVGVVATAMMASGLLLLSGLGSEQPFWIVTTMSLSMGVLGLAEGPFWASAVEVGRGRGGLSASVVNTGGNALGMLAPVITPWVSDSLGLGWKSGLALSSIVVILGGACWLGISPEPPDRVDLEPSEPFVAPGETVPA